MLVYVFLVFGGWQGVMGEDDICVKYLHEACVHPEEWGFPATEEDFNRQCSLLLRKIDCEEDYTNKCHPGNDPKKPYRHQMRALAEEVCQEDSQLHSRIVANIGCFHDVVENDLQACHDFVSEKEVPIMKRIEAINVANGYGEDVFDENLYKPLSCLVASLQTICLANKSSRCGSDSEELIFELIGKSGFLELSCGPANGERLEEYIGLLELESEEKAALNRILGKE